MDNINDLDEPLVVSVNRAMRLLDCGRTRLYALLGSGEIDSFRDGLRSRKIVRGSITAYIARQIQADRQRVAG